MSIIIGLTGRARSGKDTAAAHLQAGGFWHLKFSAALKDMLRALPGMTEAHIDGEFKDHVHPAYGISPRRMMQTLGTEWGRGLDPEFWTNVMRATIADVLTEDTFHTPRIVISDVRFDNEAELIRELGGIIVHIQRGQAAEVEDHASERGIQPATGDVVIRNDSSISDLHARIDGVVMAMARVG